MKKWKGILRNVILVFAALALFYLLGPSPKKPLYATNLPVVPSSISDLDAFVHQQEASHTLRKDNEARIIWANDSLRTPTEYAIVYLHGFTASQEEGDPVHTRIAQKFGCNLYLSRLSEHGLDTAEQMIRLTADSYWESAKQAFAIGKVLGKKIILMGTSTGGTQALQLAATYPNDIAGVVLLSPNIAINDPNAWLLNNNWGLQIARLVKGSDYIISSDTAKTHQQYWTSKYRLEAAVQLQEMVETTMTPTTFAKVKQPLLLLYYYKNDSLQDKTVRVDAMLNMFEQLGTPSQLKHKQAIPNAGEHVIGSYLTSGDVPSVIAAVDSFMRQQMGIASLK